MALKPIITRRDVHEYIIINNMSGSLQDSLYISSIWEVKTKKLKLHQLVKDLLMIDDSKAESELEPNYSSES